MSMRELNPDIWIDIFKNRIDKNRNIVISDLRFLNEAKCIKELGE